VPYKNQILELADSVKKIFVVGAGRTAISLISYLTERAKERNWFITVGDQSLELAKQKTAGLPNTKAIQFDVFNARQRKREVSKADVVVSLLPQTLHVKLVDDCIENKVNLLTASYISDQMRRYDEAAHKAGIILLNGMGLDPVIDHMETMRLITKIRDKGGKVL